MANGRIRARMLRHGGTLGLAALLAGLAILVTDWLLVLDAPDERIRESVVADIAGPLLAVTGAAILAVLALHRGDAARFQREGRAAEAVVEDVALGFFGTTVTLRFTGADGTPQRVRLRGSNLALRPGFGPGTRVAIRHDPGNPRRIRFQTLLDSLAPQD